MRCHEARNRINGSLRAESGPSDDRQLLDHLRLCSACARQAQAAEELRRSFRAARLSDNEDTLPFSALMARVEARAARKQRLKSMEIPFMKTLTNRIKQQRRLSLGIGVAIVALAFLTLVPFKIDQTVGFEVAVAGVDKNVALNSDRISEMLTALGMADAKIDVTGCEATCNVLISKLQSAEDAQLVRLAFDKFGDEHCVVELLQVREGTSASLIDHAQKAFFISMLDESSDLKFEGKLVQCLGEDFSGIASFKIKLIDGEFVDDHVVWVSDDSVDGASLDIDIAAYCDFFGGNFANGDSVFCIKVIGDSAECYIPGFNGKVIGKLDEETIQRLRDQGFLVEIEEYEDGSRKEVRITKDFSDNSTTDETEEDAAKQPAAIPDGFSLSQNYPNPFNPSTSISYSIPKSGHVTLEIFNVNGQKVTTLVNGMVSAGEHTVEWDGTSESGSRVASGIYLYRFKAGDVIHTKKMNFIK